MFPHTAKHAFCRGLAVIAASLLIQSCRNLPEVPRPPVTIGRDPVSACIAAREQGKLSPVIARAQALAPAAGNLKRFTQIAALSAPEPLIGGNKVTLLQDGPATFQAMRRVVEGAHDHIDLETYAYEGKGFPVELGDLLIRKRAEGVRVHLIYDSIGSITMPTSFFQKLRAAGIEVLEFNPVNPLHGGTLWGLNHRTHGRILAVDGKVVITGGLNISDVYSHPMLPPDVPQASDYRKRFWRDTDIEIEGPAAAEFERRFLETWRHKTGATLKDSVFFPPLAPKGQQIVQVLDSDYDLHHMDVFQAFTNALRAARHHIYITMAFFVPDRQSLDALTNAARCGVDVRLILPDSTGSNIVMIAHRGFYEQLLAAGVKLYEFTPGVLHAKVADIDGVWSSVGSANIDKRSYILNDELNTVILGRQFATQVAQVFQKDMAIARPVDPAQWARRDGWERFKEKAAQALDYIL